VCECVYIHSRFTAARTPETSVSELVTYTVAHFPGESAFSANEEQLWDILPAWLNVKSDG